MLPYKRSQRVSHLLRKELSDIILNRLKDPRLGFLSVMEVDISSDLKVAKVYISVLKKEEQEETMQAIESATRFIRGELSKRLRMRVLPELFFKLDTSSEYATKINRLLHKIEDDE